MPSNPNAILGAAGAGHLLRRMGFGGRPDEVAEFALLTRDQAMTELLKFTLKPKAFKPSGKEFDQAHNNWIKYLIRTRNPLQDKLVLFWHDHFATGFSKVQDLKQMGAQVKTLYLGCAGDMRELCKKINKDAAMMEWLDTVRNHKAIPNENYGRELLELFTVGTDDLFGVANYTQDDIVQIARAFTGWTYDDKNVAFLDTSDHDFSANYPARGLPIGAPIPPGNKLVFQQTGGFGAGGTSYAANGEGTAEIDTVIDVLFLHTDSGGGNTVARRTAKRLLEYLAHPDPSVALIDEVIADSSFDSTFSIGALVRAIGWNDAFYDSAAPAPFSAATKKSVIWPVDYVVRTLRLFKMRLSGKQGSVGPSYGASVRDFLANMGQILLDPPSVFGWNWEGGWVSSSTLLARYDFANAVISARSGSQFKPDKFFKTILVETDPGDIVDAVLGYLGVADQLTTAERQMLIDYVSDNGTVPSLDLTDYDTRNRKLHGLFGLILQSAAYQMH